MEQKLPFILILLASGITLLCGILAPSKDRKSSCMHGLHRSGPCHSLIRNVGGFCGFLLIRRLLLNRAHRRPGEHVTTSFTPPQRPRMN